MTTITSPRKTIRPADYEKSALPNDIIITERQAEFLGLEEAPADIGKSWEEHLHQKSERNRQ